MREGLADPDFIHASFQTPSLFILTMIRKFQIEIITQEEIEAIDIETALKILYPHIIIEIKDEGEGESCGQ